MKQFELFSGETLKESGIALVGRNNSDWLSQVTSIIKWLASTRNTFTAEDLRIECGKRGIPRPSHPNAWGAAFNSAAKAHIVKRIGYDKNHLSSAHARIVGIWSKQ